MRLIKAQAMNSKDQTMMTKPAEKVFVETYGCQMNVLDSELVQGQLESQGYQFVDDSDQADVVLLNTCSVRELSEHNVEFTVKILLLAC